MDYRYTLEKYDSTKRNKYTCPKCGHKHRFKRYIDTVTGQQLLSLIHIPSPRDRTRSRMPSSA